MNVRHFIQPGSTLLTLKFELPNGPVQFDLNQAAARAIADILLSYSKMSFEAANAPVLQLVIPPPPSETP